MQSFLGALAFLLIVVAHVPAFAFAGEGPMPVGCAQRDMLVRTALDEHRYAQDVAPDRLAAAFNAMIRARKICLRNEVQGLALYDDIGFELDLRSVLYRTTVIGPLD